MTSPLAIKKLHIKETISFAINNIPYIHQPTLEKLLALIYTNGTYGSLTVEQLLAKMRLTLKYVPQACPKSLLTLADLLEIPQLGSGGQTQPLLALSPENHLASSYSFSLSFQTQDGLTVSP